MLDLVLIISISSVIAGVIGLKPYFYLVSVYYVHNHHQILKLTTSSDGMFTILIYCITAFAYFLVESFFGTSPGKVLMKNRLLKTTRQTNITKPFIRAALKILPPIVLVDSIYIFISKYGQRYSDRKLQYVVVTQGENQGFKLKRFIMLSTLIFIVPLLVEVLLVSALGIGFANLTPPPSPRVTITPSLSRMNFIFLSNSSLDIIDFAFGGISIFFLDLVEIMSGSYIDGILIGSSLVTYPSFALFGVIPQLIFEVIAYALGISSSFVLMKTVLNAVEMYAKPESLRTFLSTFYRNVALLGSLILLSLLVLYFAAYVETYWTAKLLNNYYY